MRRPTLAPIAIVLAALLIPAAYMGAYYALLEAPAYWEVVQLRPHYHLRGSFIEELLEPAHQIDRRVRPSKWASLSDYGLEDT